MPANSPTVPLSLTQRTDTFRCCPAFKGVGELALAILAEAAVEERYAAGATITAMDETAEAVFLIAEGEADVLVGHRDTPVRTLGRNELFGEYGLFDQRHRTATVQARTACILLSVDYVRFRAVLMAYPAILFALMTVSVRRLLELERSVHGN